MFFVSPQQSDDINHVDNTKCSNCNSNCTGFKFEYPFTNELVSDFESLALKDIYDVDDDDDDDISSETSSNDVIALSSKKWPGIAVLTNSK